MKITVIASHPDIATSKINSAWIRELKKFQNIEVRFLDELYSTGKEIDIKLEQKFLEDSQRIVFQYPFYWYNMPPLLRDYMDRVLEYSWAYGPGGNSLKGKEFLCAISLGAPESAFQGGGYNNYTLTEFLRPLQATANFVQMEYLPYFALFNAPNLTEYDIELSSREYIKHINDENLNFSKVLESLRKKDSNKSLMDL